MSYTTIIELAKPFACRRGCAGFSARCEDDAEVAILGCVSSFLSLATVLMLLHHQFGSELYVIGSGAFIGWAAVAYGGRLPIWMRKRWGMAEDADLRNLALRIWVPILLVLRDYR